MKKIVTLALAAALFMGIGVQNAAAANSLAQGSFSLGVDTSSDAILKAKYLISSDLAIVGGIGIGILGKDAKGTNISILGGARKFFKVADFAPFAGGAFQYDSYNDSNNTDITVYAEGGAEYFLAKQFSVEGAVNFGYKSTEVKNGAKTSYIGTRRAAVGFNFYF
jgi:hypothetical protein